MLKRLFYIFAGLWIIYIFFVVFAAAYKPFGRFFLENNDPFRNAYGDLYDFALIQEFKEQIRLFPNKENAVSLEKSPIMLIGDSFSAIPYDDYSLPYLVERDAGIPVYYISPTSTLHTPLDVKHPRKLLIFEIAEWHLAGLSDNYLYKWLSNTPAESVYNKTSFSADIAYFFRSNIAVKVVKQIIRIARYKFLHVIDERIPLFSTDPKLLFYSEDVNTFYQTETDQYVSSLADSFVQLKNKLATKYNTDLLLVVIPGKYSLYNDFINKNDKYDNLIPKLQVQLLKNKVSFIDTYSLFKANRINDGKLLYYAGDSHYNAVGKALLAKEIVKKIKDMGYGLVAK